MQSAISAARLSCQLALAAKDRNPRDAWARERYEYALMALEKVAAIEIDRKRNDRLAINESVA
jgi:hypothetical protein